MVNDQIIDEASEWFVTLREEGGDAATQERFMTWLRTSPEHVRAYLGVVTLWSDLPAADAERKLDAQTLIARARAVGNVEEWPGAKAIAAEAESGNQVVLLGERRAKQLFRRPLAMAATFAALMLTASTLAWFVAARASTYTTAVGEQRSLTLSDGSKVQLNSRSRVRVKFSEHERAIEMLEGQALFRVAKDSQRPFFVRSDGAQVRAVGTEFDVYRRRESTIVTVVEGRVAVLNNAPRSEATAQLRPASVMVSAGQQVTLQPKTAPQPIAANLSAAMAWTEGKLIFRSTPLSDVVEEFNRYNDRRIVLDATVDDFPITAVFASTDPRILVAFLRSQPEVSIRTSGSEIEIARR